MKTVTFPSGVYAVDGRLQEFEIIEKKSSNVAFIGTDIPGRRVYVQFKKGSGYMYHDVDLDTLSFIPAAESIGKFVSSQIVGKFPSEKMETSLIQFLSPLILTGEVTGFSEKGEPGMIIIADPCATIEYIEPQEPEF